ncbi:MAG: glycerol kinase GlpK [Candidatus Omnitrophica bacterium]|nr:glycerol kinase GlpK [Candidatus Omnitrophota bacterium]
MQYILAIDQGTTGSRVILYDKNGKRHESVYREFPQHFPKPGWVEHNPDDIWQSVNKSIQEILRKAPKARIAAIGITNQRETTVVWDRVTGLPVYSAIVWQCRRTAARCDELKKKRGENEFFRKRTGLPIDAYFSATKLEWLLNNVSGVCARARRGNLCFGTTDSWILWKLTGGNTHATDYTNASRTMLFDINRKKWDEDILKRFKIPYGILPEVRNSSGIFGRTVKTGSLPAGIPISGIAGDQQASLFGQACFEPGTMKNTYGTGSFVLLNTGKKMPVTKHGLIITLGCGPSCEPVYVLEGPVFVAGSAIQWMRDKLHFLDTAHKSCEMASGLDANDGVYFVPALVGLGAPYWDQDARGAIFGLTRGTTPEHLVRAAIEAMCYQTRDVLEAMRKDSKLKIRSLKVDGGAAANNFLCQFQADILGVDVIRPDFIETTSLGAAYLAGIGVGYWKNTDEVKKYWSVDRVFSPEISGEKAQALYKGWHEAVKRTLTHYPAV